MMYHSYSETHDVPWLFGNLDMNSDKTGFNSYNLCSQSQKEKPKPKKPQKTKRTHIYIYIKLAVKFL